MARIDTRVAPYYDTTEEEYAKNYYRLLAVPGRVAQAREITVLQGLLHQALKALGDSFMSNGDVVEGCQVIVSQDKTTVTVSSGKIYMEGLVMDFPESTLTINGSGTEVIGVKIMEYIVTDSDDTSLKDPAQGFDNYGQTGCDRVKKVLVAVKDDAEASPLATLIDGSISVEVQAPTYDTMSQTLARRTYDESGSYLVEGLNVRVEDGKTADTYTVVVEPGKAYVLGYELKIPTARRITVPRSTTTSRVTASNYVFNDSYLSYMLDADPYVESISSVNGRMQETEQQTVNTNTDSAVLSHGYVTSLISIKQGSKEFTIGTGPTNGDCYLLRDGTRYYVKWNGTSNYPTQGVAYTVIYQYNTDFVQGVDYELKVDSTGSYLEFSGEGAAGGAAHVPLNGTNFVVEYNQYLSRKDTVYMDYLGALKVEQGSPDEDGYASIPSIPVNTLAIANIYNPPNGVATTDVTSLQITVTNVGLTRFTMQDIQDILDRVQKTEYNQALLSLNDDARNRTSVAVKKGIITDPLVDFSRIDNVFNDDGSGNKLNENLPLFLVALDLDLGYAYNPVSVYEYEFTGTSATTKTYKRLITLGVSGETTVLSQANATKSFQINPYTVYPQLPSVEVTPSVDSWVDTNIIVVPQAITTTAIVKTTAKTLYSTVRKNYTGWSSFVNASGQSRSSSTTKTTSSTSTKDVYAGTTTSTTTTESVISQQSIAYMRSRTLTVYGYNFPPSLDNIKCTLDDVEMTITPIESTTRGTLGNSVKANSDGYVAIQFTIPAGKIRTGSREVRLYSDTKIENYQSEGYAMYRSTGIMKNVQRTITTVTTVLYNREVTTNVTNTNYVYVDPVGQTFVVDDLCVLKGVNVYFEAKPSSNETVDLEIRNVSNGNIGTTVYGLKTLRPSQVNVSSNASVATRFNFDDPVVLEANTEYAFVVRSSSDKYRIWVSEIGGTDVHTGSMVLKNAYLTGVMMSSSNNSIWTAHQTTDIKFDLISDVYNASGSIVFPPISVDNITRLDLQAEYIELNNTSVKWSYSINGGTTYYSISPGVLKELGEEVDNVVLKVDLSRTSSENVTPLIANDTFLLVGSKYDTEGTYVGVRVTGLDNITKATVIMDVNIPASGTLKVYVLTDDNDPDSLTECVLDPSQTIAMNDGWQECAYVGNLSTPATNCRLVIKTTGTSTSTPKYASIRSIMS